MQEEDREKFPQEPANPALETQLEGATGEAPALRLPQEPTPTLMIARQFVQSLFLHLGRAVALAAVILALKTWLEHPAHPAEPNPMKAVPAQLTYVFTP